MRSFITCVVVSHHKWEVYFPQFFVFTYMAISQHFFLVLEKVLFLISYYFNLNLFYHICKLKLTLKLELPLQALFLCAERIIKYVEGSTMAITDRTYFV